MEGIKAEAGTTYQEEFGWKPKERNWNELTTRAWKRPLVPYDIVAVSAFVLSAYITIAALIFALYVFEPWFWIGIAVAGLTGVLLRDSRIFLAREVVRFVDKELCEERLRIARISLFPFRKWQYWVNGLACAACLSFLLVFVASLTSLFVVSPVSIAACVVGSVAFACFVLEPAVRWNKRSFSRLLIREWEGYRLSRGPKEGETTVEAWEEVEYPRFRVREAIRVTFEWEEEACLVRHGELGTYGSGPTLEAAVEDLKEVMCCYVDDYFFAFEKATKSFWKEAHRWLEFVELTDEPDPQVLREIRNAVRE